MKRGWHDWLAAGCWGAAGVLLVMVGTRRLDYWAGCRNGEMFDTMRWFLASLAAAPVLMLVGSFFMAMRFRRAGRGMRWLWIALVVLGLAGGPVCWMVSPSSSAAYERGVRRWLSQEVNLAGIRAWANDRPRVTAPTSIPAESWPALLAGTNPESVDDMPTGGVLITWGPFGTWSSQRQVYVGLLRESRPPDVTKAGDEWIGVEAGASPWTPLQPGMYLHVVSGG